MSRRPTKAQCHRIARAYAMGIEGAHDSEAIAHQAQAFEERLKASSLVVLDPRRFRSETVDAVVFIDLAECDDVMIAVLGQVDRVDLVHPVNPAA